MQGPNLSQLNKAKLLNWRKNIKKIWTHKMITFKQGSFLLDFANSHLHLGSSHQLLHHQGLESQCLFALKTYSMICLHLPAYYRKSGFICPLLKMLSCSLFSLTKHNNKHHSYSWKIGFYSEASIWLLCVFEWLLLLSFPLLWLEVKDQPFLNRRNYP